LADGSSIKGYLGEVIDEFDLKKKFILSIVYLQPIMILPRKNGLLKLKMPIKKQTWIANFVVGCRLL
jgi:cyclohexanone monooxygenase